MKGLRITRKHFAAFIIGVGLVGAISAFSPMVSHAQPAARNPFAPTTNPACDPKIGNTAILGFPFWYEYLKGEIVDGTCRPTLTQPADIWLVVAAIFIILLRIAAITAIGIIIYGGFRYIMSKGQANDIAGAKETISNAIVGLILTVISARLIGFIAGRFTGATDNDFLLPEVGLGANSNALQAVLTVAFQLAGAFAVLYIAWGGITYSRSAGDPGAIKEAKETILYALVGLIIAIFAQVIVFFIFNRID